jgi:serine/threonine protein kinase/tetratricopeptide (TPR) repeat protein
MPMIPNPRPLPAHEAQVAQELAGTTIGPFRIVEPLGHGGVGIVFRALDQRTGQVVALKTARQQREGNLASLRREIDLLRQIRHRGVVRILDGGAVDGRPWYAMELLEGETLGSQMSRVTGTLGGDSLRSASQPSTVLSGDAPTGPPPTPLVEPAIPAPAERQQAGGGRLDELLTIIRRLCEPLAYVHGERFVHRDVKPANIFLRRDGVPVLMDFGLGLLLGRESSRESLAVDAIRGGTPAYMAPEQLRGERIDARADLFALGCIMYEAITGRPPFLAEDVKELMKLHARGEFAPPSRYVYGVPPALDELIVRLLATRPADRIGHASDVAAVLGELGAEGWPHADDPAPRPYLYRPDLVGRRGPLEQGRACVTRLKKKTGGYLCISGESGIGKTSLLAQLASAAAEDGVRVISAECVALGIGDGESSRRGGPLHPFAPFLRVVADRCLSGGPEATQLLLGDWGPVLGAYEPTLATISDRLSGGTPLAQLPTEAARRRLFDALSRTLAALAKQRPVLLMIDDLQWADELSIAFLNSVPPSYFESHPVLIVAAARSEEARPDLDQLLERADVDRSGLAALDLTAVRAMAQGMLGGSHLEEELVQFLAAESSGNPFFVAEYLRAAVDQNLLTRDARGRWRRAPGVSPLPTVPGSILELVKRRLEGLSAPAQRLVEIAAVMGREVDGDDLAALSAEEAGLAGELFVDSLRELRSREILVDSPSGRARFTHDKLREAAYQRLADERRKLLHGRAARWLEEKHGRAPSSANLPQLAYHYERTEDYPRAIRYLDEAGEAMHRTFAGGETMRFLERARTLEQTTGQTADALTRAKRERLLGEAHYALGDQARTLAHLLEAARLLGVPFPAGKVGPLARSLAEVAKEARRRLLPGSSAAAPALDPSRDREAAYVYEKLPTALYYVTGDAGQVLCSALMNLSVAERLGPSPQLALAYGGIHHTAAFIPLHKLAEYYGRRARGLLPQLDDPAAETLLLIHTSAYGMGAAQWDRVMDDTARIREVARRIGFLRRWEEGTAQLGTTLFMLGEFVRSRLIFEELRLSAARGDYQTQDWALVGIAQADLITGDPSTALTHLKAAAALLDRGLVRPEQIYTLGPLALAHHRAGNRQEARVAADACATWIAKGSPIACYNIFGYTCVAEVYLGQLAATTDVEERRRLLSSARQAVKQVRAIARIFPAAAAAAELWRGELCIALGDRKRAVEHFELSRDTALVWRMPYDEALALAALARHGDPASAGSCRTRARALFTKMAAVHELGRL